MLFNPLRASQDSDALTLASLHQLHATAIATTDPVMLARTLGTYVALAAYRSSRASTLPSAVSNPWESLRTTTTTTAQTTETRLYTSISNILKAVNDAANNTINNIK